MSARIEGLVNVLVDTLNVCGERLVGTLNVELIGLCLTHRHLSMSLYGHQMF
jgi:hypothetical protein